MSADIPSISALFDIPGRLISTSPHGSGHIHDSYLATYEDKGVTRRYLHQRINDRVFTDPPALMHNIQRATEHLRRKLSAEGASDVRRRTLTVIPTRAGTPSLLSDDGAHWRTYRFVEGTRTHQTIESPEQAYQAARAFGRFQALLADLPGPRLVETIPDFHNTPKRWAALARAVEVASRDRASAADEEIAFAARNRALAPTLTQLHEQSRVPERITHNDTKLNNVLFDVASAEAICVVDLDTVMPGLSLYDFGDMVRTMTSAAAEDETDLARVEVQVPLFEALVRGYLESAGPILTAAERESLVAAGKTIAFEQGLRFLTDYLGGDTYYKIARPGHNLDRCRTQFRLVQSLARREAELNAIVETALEASRTAR